MLRNEPSLELLRHQLRKSVCTQCRWRPAHSEALSPDVARSCESACMVFRHLPELARTAHLLDPMLRPPELTLRHRIEDLFRHDTPLALRHCPLHLYEQKVAQVVAEAFGR